MASLPLPGFLTKSTRRSSSRSTGSSGPSATLTEALRTNPFGTSRTSLLDDESTSSRRKALNKDLSTLANLFPDIKTEVLRELLLRYDGTSRLHVCVGQLLKYRAEWVKGRWQVPPRTAVAEVPLDETFRSENYKDAVKTLLYLEFKALSKSTVDAVLAESNSSYTCARPVLKDLSKKTWRATFNSLNIFRKKKEVQAPPSFIFQRTVDGKGTHLKDTGSEELDEELASLYLNPVVQQQQEEQQIQDREIAEEINLNEAEKAEALYECDCCCSDTTFESMSACTANGHIICFDCIRHTIHEATFGQGWGKSIDVEKGTLKCLAPLSDETCEGCLPHDLVHRAISSETSGTETWKKFEDRLASDALLKSQMRLVHCPFCSYAESDPLYRPAGYRADVTWRVRSSQQLGPSLTTLLLLELLPVFFVIFIILSLIFPWLDPRQLFQTSLHNLALRIRSPRFVCQSPACSRVSCLRCLKAWHDPHVCHEPLLLSLRTTVEAARTSAVKRTCPRCGLSFVKASGCNKLTCVCGYAMCYLCRKSLSGDNQSAGRAGPAGGQGEGYRHFCEHFRVNPGRPCDQCDKCDLYRAEDEDLVVRRAGEEAEREWRLKENMVGIDGFDTVNSDAAERNVEFGLLRWWKKFRRGEWDLQIVVDWAVENVVVVEA